jgi:hypothetical protein
MKEDRYERFIRRSELIQEMKQFCKENKIYNYADFMFYCQDNNKEWFKELITGTQVCKYMMKYLKH